MRQLIGVWGMVVGAAALYTGASTGHFFTHMTGFLPPHYGYSAYAVVPLLFISNEAWLRWVAGATLLLSGNRASWVGALTGALWRRPMLAALLCALAAFGGLLMKPRIVAKRTDSVRVSIWKAALATAKRNPEGIGRGGFCVGVAGRMVDKAHSDVLQLLVEGGVALTAYVLAALILGLYYLPDGPEKDVVIALTTQSIIDNRLHHPACAALYAAAWLAAWRARPAPEAP